MSSSGLPGCVTCAVTCGSGAPRPSFRRTPGKQSKGKNLAANDRASRIRPIFASQARLSFFSFTSERPDQFVL